MYLIIETESNLVIETADSVKSVMNGIYMNEGLLDREGNKRDMVMANLDNYLTTVQVPDSSIPENYIPRKFKYVDNTFVISEDWKPEAIPVNYDDKIAALETKVNDAIMELSMMIMMGQGGDM